MQKKLQILEKMQDFYADLQRNSEENRAKVVKMILKNEFLNEKKFGANLLFFRMRNKWDSV